MKVKHVLLIEDDPDDQEIFRLAMVNMHGVTCSICDDGEQALNLIKTSDAPDIIFLDWHMPRMTGEEFLKKRSTTISKEVPVFVLSSYLNDFNIPQIMALGARKHYTKPASIGELENIIHSSMKDIQPGS